MRSTQNRSYANRGMNLEAYIIQANATYKQRRLALIDKIPTPVKVTKLHQSGKQKGAIKEAHFESKSTVDFRGLFQGKSLAFDAKSTQEKMRFPLDNIEEHQYQYLAEHQLHQGISFLVIRFEQHHETYILPFIELEKWWEAAKNGGRKSIPYSFFVEHCIKVSAGRGIAIDYLAALTTVLRMGEIRNEMG